MVAGAGTGRAQGTPATLRLGVVSFYNPRIMYLKYQPLVDYLGESTGRPWELVVSDSYEDTVDALCEGRTQLAYLGPLTYVRAHAACGAEPLVRLQTDGRATYRAFIMVRKDSPIKTLAELRGKRIGFGAPLSTSSHLVPRGMLMDAGLAPGKDVFCRYYRHHERAALAVLLGEVAACGIRDIVGRKFEERGLRVLAASEPIPNFPLAVSPGAPEWLTTAVVRALVMAPSIDPEVKRLMAGWDEELASGFALSRDDDFLPVRRLAARVFGPAWAGRSEAELRCGGGE
jgi:phosphonate transport system substrate-binding protein